MSLPVFPALSLPGIEWPIKRAPSWRTVKQVAMSGKRTAFALQASPIYKYELSLSVLRSAPAFAELQTLIGFYNALYGGQGTFAFYDPNDFQAVSQSFGVGDGVTTSFQLVRAYAGFAEPVFVPYQSSIPAVLPMLRQTAFAPSNLVTQSNSGSTSGLVLTAATATASQTDPNGGSLAAGVAETTASSAHTIAYGSGVAIPTGATATASLYVKPGAGATIWQLYLQNPASPYQALYANFDLSAGAVDLAAAANGAPAAPVAMIAAAGGGWFRISVSGVLGASVASAVLGLAGANNSGAAALQPSYAGSTSNSATMTFPQIEIVAARGAPGAFNPTLATAYFGGPQIFVAGTYVDPTAYTIGTNGAINFASAPSSGAALTWSGFFGWPCRFDDDSLGIENFMYQLHALKSLKFSTEILP